MPFLMPLLPMIGIGTGTAAGVGGVVGAGATGAALSALPVAAGVGMGGAITTAATAAGVTAGTSILSAMPNLLMSGASLLEGISGSQTNKANAAISEVQAKQAKLNAAYNEGRSREESARLMGEQAARFGASGVAMEGTPLLVMADQARQSELEALAIRDQGLQASEGYKAEASGYRRAATNSLMGGVLNAAAYGYGANRRYKNPYYYS